ncbi:ras-responsive element-binding protein 1-like isoform X2 [Babylonia areolata]|uniref:ras-responsive element-binding protein 1-like isoform X2 n=1 Tax=Babylonia areolata TaxID=304850 RepID=UPI003FD075ED
MLDRVRRQPESPVAAAGKMSRRKQACPSRSIKAASDSTPVAEEGPPSIQPHVDALEPLPQITSLPEHSNTDSGSHAADNSGDDRESPDIPPLVINTDAPSPPPPHPSSIQNVVDVTPPLTEDTNLDGAQAEDLTPLPPSSPGLDIPPESSAKPPLLNLVPASPPSPDHPSTPSSLNSGSSQADPTSSNKQKRGKKIMPVQGEDGVAHYQCPVCKERLKSNHDFTAHIRNHNTAMSKKPNMCIICHKQLSSQSSLDRHMLVHSGERPFICKVCGMSFTTNGNMHRHSRIHNKDDVKAAHKAMKVTKSSKAKTASVPLAPKPAPLTPPSSFIPTSMPAWHRPVVYNPDRSATSMSNVISGVELQKLMAPTQISMITPDMISLIMERKHKMPLTDEDAPPSKRMREDNGEDSTSGCLVPVHSSEQREHSAMTADSGNQQTGSAPPAHVVKEPQQLVKSSCRNIEDHQQKHKQYQQCDKTMLGHDTPLGQPAAGASIREKMQLLDQRRDREAASIKAASDGMSDLFQCSDCQRKFDSLQKLDIHRVMDHFTTQQAEQYVQEKLSADRNSVERADKVEENAPGFHDLDFMDFTSRKFSLAAKAQCEKVPRKSSSKFHNFKCDECCCCFPNKSALMLHLASHVSHNVTQCTVCQCHFTNADQVCTHMYSHTAKSAFAESRDEDASDTAGKPETIQKKDFLALCGLISKEELSGCRRNETVIENLAKEQNNRYFEKVLRVFGNVKVKESNPDSDIRGTGSQIELSMSIPSITAPSTDNARSTVSAPPQLPSSVSSPHQPLTPSMTSKEISLTPNKLFQSGVAQSVPSALQPVNFVAPSIDAGGPVLNATNGSIDKDQSKDIFQCSYCGDTFLTKRALKAHVRSHFGSPKYQCPICTYSSSDKSTLTRHMRTHNGQRPFECVLCDFGFTTKANCERHIRKRHQFVKKEEVGKFLKYKSSFENQDIIQPPSTVCQYCGEDLKFVQLLQVHMKTHCNGQQGTFICSVCSARSCSKSRVIRHIQKQHPDVLPTDLEALIQTIPLATPPPANYDFQDLDDDSDDGGADFDTASSSPPSTPGVDRTPPMAHSTPVLTGRLGGPAMETPLDFSLKNVEIAARLSTFLQQHGGGGSVVVGEGGDESEEEPMDLSTKGNKASSSSSSISLSPSPAASLPSAQGGMLLKGSRHLGAVIPCHLCKMTFNSQEAAQQHLVTTHQVSPSSAFTIVAPSDNNNNTSTAAPTLIPFMPMMGLPGILQARPLVSTHPAFPASIQQKIATLLAQHTLPPGVLTPSFTHTSTPATNTNTSSTPAKESGSSTPSTTTTTTASSGSESSCDLASVNKIIESTTSQNLQVFLKPQTVTSGSDDSEPQTTPWESADEDSDQSLDKLYKQSLNGTILIKTEDVDDMEEGREEGDADSMFSFAEAQEENLSRSQSPKTKASPNTKAAKKTEPGSAPVKKKRNSYADSPHKMKCPHCPRSFPWISSLNRHMLTHTVKLTGQKPFKCPRCSVTFSTKSNRERHLIRKHGLNMLDPDSRQTMDRPYKCHLCVFSSFATEGNLLKHYEQRHKGVTPPERYLRREEGQEEGYNMADMEDMANLDGWSENNSVDTDDPEASISSPSKAGVKSLVENLVTSLIKNNDAKTSHSPSKAATPTTDTAQTVEEVDEDSNGNEPAATNDASLTSPSFTGSAERHINPERDNYNVDKITFCWKCSEQFTSRKLLVRHLKEHNIDLPFKCYLCDASFDRRCECLTHQEKSHPSDWAILKEKNGVGCLDKFAEDMDYTVEKICKAAQLLEEGKEGEGGDQTSTTPSGAGEEGQSELVASDYLQRKVYCALCAKRFWSLQDLRRHMRSHTGERPFECDLCHRRFTLKHSMMRHRRKHEKNANGGSPTAFSDDEEEAQLSEPSGKAPATHMGSGHKALRQHLAATAASLKSTPSTNIPTTVLENNNVILANPDNNKDDDGDAMGDDILHNLLGVESETIDEIIDKKDSAATLLGV